MQNCITVNSQWINIKDRLPEKFQYVLCYVPKKDYGAKVVIDYIESARGIFAREFEWGTPTHWMPLPSFPTI